MISGMRSRKEMEAIIASGASVMLPNGGVATRVEQLPTAWELAKGDPEKEAQFRAGLEAQIDQLQGRLAGLDRPGLPEGV
jgi:hypothetical protein